MAGSSLGERLAFARETAGLSARRVDELVALSGGYTSRIETGKTQSVGSTTLAEYARIFGFSLHWLITGEGAAPSAKAIKAAAARAVEADALKKVG